MRFTVGMPVYDDPDGPVFTSASLLAHHDEHVEEVLIVDNKPDSRHSKGLAEWCKQHPKLRYVAFPDPVGTAPPKGAVFAHAKSAMVVCVDSHVLLLPGALAALAEFYRENPDAVDDLVQGPLVYNDMKSLSSSLNDTWGGDSLWGQWQTNPELKDRKWFQILAQGMGLFASSKKGWLGFNPHFRGFGGEERYVHEKYRRAGKRTWCVSGLRWWHRFNRPTGYPLLIKDKCRNAVIGHVELGIPLDRAREHFVAGGRVPQEYWDAVVAEAEALTQKKSSGCGCANKQGMPGVIPQAPAPVVPGPVPLAKKDPADVKTGTVGLDELFAVAVRHPGDVNEHMELIRDLAAECGAVTEFASGAATIALIAGVVKGGGRLTSYHHEYRKDAKELLRLAGGEKHFAFVTGDVLKADIAPTDMLFVDSASTAARLHAELERHHVKVAKYIVLCRTDTFGEYGSDGGPGLRPAVRQFLKGHKDWFVYKSFANNNGLTVLCRDPAKKPKLPGTLTVFKNAAKALMRNAAAGFAKVPLEVMNSRLSECEICEHRRDDRCSLCGCYLEIRPDGGAGKAAFAKETCPEGRWTNVE